jgi:acyl-ACP thioesterase
MFSDSSYVGVITSVRTEPSYLTHLRHDGAVEGRTFTGTRRVRLGDADASGRLRLDALARYLQDVATDDVDDAEVSGDPDDRTWVLRRLAVTVHRWPQFRDPLELVTWCSATAGSAAERRTTVTVRDDVAVESEALWAFVGPDGRPARLGPEFLARYSPSTPRRRLTTRLLHELAPPGAARAIWPLRATDLDVLGHVNNAVHWAAVEEVLRGIRGAATEVLTGEWWVEMEYRAALEADDEPELVMVRTDDGFACWLECDGTTRASAVARGALA